MSNLPFLNMNMEIEMAGFANALTKAELQRLCREMTKTHNFPAKYRQLKSLSEQPRNKTTAVTVVKSGGTKVLKQYLSSPFTNIQTRATWTLGLLAYYGAVPEKEVPGFNSKLIEMLSPTPEVACFAAITLRHLNQSDSTTVLESGALRDIIYLATEHSYYFPKRAALDLIAKSKSNIAFRQLLILSRDKNDGVRKFATEQLLQFLGTPRGANALLKVIENPHDADRRQARGVLVEFGLAKKIIRERAATANTKTVSIFAPAVSGARETALPSDLDAPMVP